MGEEKHKEDTERDLKVSVTEWVSTFSERGLEVNINKRKVMKICRENEEEEINIEWKQQKLDIVGKNKLSGSGDM